MQINIYTLCRSGNHAVIFWLMNNLCTITDKIDVCCYWNDEKKVYYYNNCSRFNYFYLTDFNYLIKSYEDIYPPDLKYDDNVNVVILRDFPNFMASRYQKYKPSLGLNSSYLESYDDIKNLWIKFGSDVIDGKVIGIIYNKWLLDKVYRDKISDLLGIANVVDDTSVVANIGHGSSFCGLQLEADKNNYLNRFTKDVFGDNVDLYEKIKYDMDNDSSIKRINDTLFS